MPDSDPDLTLTFVEQLGPTPTGYQRTSGGKGFKWVPPSPEKLSQLLPQYAIEALAGRGGMGAVYRGTQKTLDRSVAIKILPPEVDDEDASYTERFKNEAKIMAKLEHPAIVPVYDFGETSEGQLYFVMSFINGTDVHQMIQSQGRLPPEHALAITAHVCDALAYAHSHGVVHRDIKPSNVLINMEGQVKVADFGLAKVDDPSQSSGLTKTGLAMGTPDYVAPETLTLGMTVDGRADLYAVGVMLYQMLTGNVPRGAWKAASIMIPGIDPRFDAIVSKAMQHDREERYQTAAEMRHDLDVILTTPLVQTGGESSAAIPMQTLAQKPVAKGPQKPQGSGTIGSSDTSVRPSENGGAPAKPNVGSKSARAPLFIGIGAAVAAVLAFFTLSGGDKPTSSAEPTRTPSDFQVPETSVRSTIAQAQPSPMPSTTPPASTLMPAADETKLAPNQINDGPTPIAASPASTTSPPSIEKPDSPAPERAEPSPPRASVPPPTPVSNPSSSNSNTTPIAFPPGQWVKVFTKFEDLPEDLRRPVSGVNYEDGWIVVPDGAKAPFITLPPHGQKDPKRNWGWRGTFKDGSTFELRLRDISTPVEQFYGCKGSSIYHSERKGGDMAAVPLVETTEKLAAALSHQVSFAAVGAHLVARRDHEPPMMATDSRIADGHLRLVNLKGAVRDIEVINLDGIPEAEALRILGVDEKGNDLRALAAKQEQQKAEQAKAMDAIAAIPELKALHDAFVKLQAERVTAPFDADLAKLNTSYLGGLEREIAKEKQKGHLDGVLLLEAEKKLIADKLPVPTEDDAGTPDALKALRKTYRDAFAKLDATRTANLKQLTDPLSIRLKQLETTLTQQNRIDHAKTVREYQEGLSSVASGATPSRTNPSGRATTNGVSETVNEAARNVRALASKLAPKEIAEWVLSRQGKLTIEKSGQRMTIEAGIPIPTSNFKIIVVTLSQTRDPRDPISDTELENLAGLKDMKELHLQGRSGFTGSFLASLAASRDLESLTIAECSFQPEQMANLSLFPNLVRLRISGGQVAEALISLPPLRKLESLSIHGVPTPEVLQSLAKHPKLLDLKCISRQFSTDHFRAIASIKTLTSLELQSSPQGPETLAVLAPLSKLESIYFSMSIRAEQLSGLEAVKTLKRVIFYFDNENADAEGVAAKLKLAQGIQNVELLTASPDDQKIIMAAEVIQKALPKTKVTLRRR